MSAHCTPSQSYKVRLPCVTNIAYTPQSLFEIADTSTTSKVLTQLVHAFVAAPGRQGTVVRTELETEVVVPT